MSKHDPLSELGRVQRIIEIIRLVTAPRSEYTVYDLADEFHVNVRTINRDIELITQTGFALRKKSGVKGRKRILRFEANMPLAIPIGFTEDELTALYLTRGIYSILKGTHFEAAAESALQKIEPLFPEEMAKRLKNAVRVKTGPVRNYKNHSAVIKSITQAVIDRRCLKISYSSALSGSHDSFIIHPYTLVFYSNALYVIAFSEKHKEPRTFAIERIGSIEKPGTGFSIPDNYKNTVNLDQHFGIYTGEAQTVKLLVAASHKQRIKDQILHSTQKFTFLKDGSIAITLTVAGREDLFKWILSQGDGVKLLEPKPWVEEFRRIVFKINELYAG